jgi:hypothetical protein
LRGRGGISELAPKLIDKLFEGTIVNSCLRPGGSEQLLALAYLAGMRHQHGQDREFSAAEAFVLRSTPDTGIASVEIQRLG